MKIAFIFAFLAVVTLLTDTVDARRKKNRNRPPTTTQPPPPPTTQPPNPQTTQPPDSAATSCSAACGATASGFQTNIIGGTDASDGEYPFYGRLFLIIDGGWYFTCGSSLVSNQYGITAAHCVNGRSASELGVQYGLTDRDGNESYAGRRVTSVTQHSGYAPGSLSDDIAIIKFDAISFRSGISPICLPANNADLYTNDVARIIGFGRTIANTSSSTARVLQEGTLTIITNAECGAIYGGITSGIICGTNPTQATCFGDSGGPLIIEDVGFSTLIGITSFVGSTPLCLGSPNGFTRVTEYLSWIEANTIGASCDL